jgi:hypothetical protein
MSPHDLAQFLLNQTPAASIHEGGVKFTELFLRYESLMITAASWVIIQVIQKSVTPVGSHRLFIRFKPIMPVVISVVMAYLPSFKLGSWDETLIYGIILGSLTGFGQKLLKQTLLGQDARLQSEKEEVTKPDAPALLADPVEVKKQTRQRLRAKIKHLIT